MKRKLEKKTPFNFNVKPVKLKLKLGKWSWTNVNGACTFHYNWDTAQTRCFDTQQTESCSIVQRVGKRPG